MSDIEIPAGEPVVAPEGMPEAKMPDTEEMTAQEARAWLASEIERHGKEDGVEPERLPITALTLIPGLFQMRDGLTEQHLGELAQALKVTGELDPIIVYRAGRIVVVLDGHHRAEAYRRAGTTAPVPVLFFRGDLEAAQAEAAAGNSKARLTLTKQERMNAAWRLIVGTTLSKARISKATTVSNGSLDNMRTVLRGLGAMKAAACETWQEAMRAHQQTENGKEIEGEMLSEMLEAQAQDYARRLRETFGSKLITNPELFARAVEIYCGRKTQDVAEVLIDHLHEHLPNGWQPGRFADDGDSPDF